MSMRMTFDPDAALELALDAGAEVDAEELAGAELELDDFDEPQAATASTAQIAATITASGLRCPG
jgi:hypothetical protein